MMVRLCMFVRARVCVSVSVCIRRVNRWVGDVRRQSDRERETTDISWLLFLSLSFSPSWGTGFESECIVKTNRLFFWRLRRRATCRLLRNQTFRNPSVFLDTHLKSCLNQQGFKIHLICSSQIGTFIELLKTDLAFQTLMLRCISAPFLNFQVFLSALSLVDLLWGFQAASNLSLLRTKEVVAFKRWCCGFAFHFICRCCIQRTGLAVKPNIVKIGHESWLSSSETTVWH